LEKIGLFFLWKKLVKHKKKIKKLKNCLRDNHIEAFLSVKWLSNSISFSVLKSTSWIGKKKTLVVQIQHLTQTYFGQFCIINDY
jgi:hypothetical protein